MRERIFAVASLLTCLAVPTVVAAQKPTPDQITLGASPTCTMIEAAARSNALPVSFFTRLLWRESSFRPDALGPVTRSGARAQGIAQFMPVTAAERGLLEPFNPVEALPKSGQLLAELRDQFGNLGLAAAAYNAGSQRVREFLAGTRNLPAETRNYVLAITGKSIDNWAADKRSSANKEGREDTPELEQGEASCQDLWVRLKHTRIVGTLQQRNVPSWCRHLNQPKASVCGVVRQQSLSTKVARLTSPRTKRSNLEHK